jgi:uncharacterized protein with HEPN domain
MSRQHELYVEDILEAISSIGDYCDEFSEYELGEDNILTDAVIRNLEVVGEAVNNLSEDFNKLSSTSFLDIELDQTAVKPRKVIFI